MTADDIIVMVEYWLETPQNSRLGTSFGNNAHELIGDPNNEGAADGFINKLMTDLPVLRLLPPGAVNVYAAPRGIDGVDLYVDINGQVFQINRT